MNAFLRAVELRALVEREVLLDAAAEEERAKSRARRTGMRQCARKCGRTIAAYNRTGVCSRCQSEESGVGRTRKSTSEMVLSVVRRHDGITPAEVAAILGVQLDAAQVALGRLLRSRKVERPRTGIYVAVRKGTNE